MADVDIDSFGEHDRLESRTDENIPLTPVGPGGVPLCEGEGSTWEPERGKQETSFGGLSRARASLNAGFVEDRVDGLYEILSEHFPKNQDVIYYDDFEVKSGELYFKGREMNP